MKIIIAGCGKVGQTLTKHLTADGHDLTVIDVRQDLLNSTVERYDVSTYNGNCGSMEALREAEVEKADILIAVTNADEVNLLSCMTAHTLNPNIHTIARIRNPEYEDQVYEMKNVFGLSMTINPEKQAAHEIENLLKYPGFLKRESFAKNRVEIVEFKIDENSRLKDVPLSKLVQTVKAQVLVCAVTRNSVTTVPRGDFVLKQGDRIAVTATTAALSELLKNLGIITHKVSKVTLAGGGKVSFYLAQRLLKSGIAVKIIEQNEAIARSLAERLPDASIVLGDATDTDLWSAQSVYSSDAFVALTGIDEQNIIMSLVANHAKIPQIITKLGHSENTALIDSLPLGSIVSPKELCALGIVRYVRAIANQAGAAVAIHAIADGRAQAIEFQVDKSCRHLGEPLKYLSMKDNVLVACIRHGSGTIMPHGDSIFQAGDSVIVVTTGTNDVYQFNDIFAE